MSQFSPQARPQPAGGVSGLAVAALACGLIGLAVPGLGLVGVVLGVVALLRASTSGLDKGLAIGGVASGALGLLTTVMCIGLLLPAIGKARQTARELKSGTQVVHIGVALRMYAADNDNWMPETPDGLDRLVAAGTIGPETLVSPHAQGGGGPSYIYLPPGVPLDKASNVSQVIVVYENPAIVPRVVNVLMLDGSVRQMTVGELNAHLSSRGAPPPARGGR